MGLVIRGNQRVPLDFFNTDYNKLLFFVEIMWRKLFLFSFIFIYFHKTGVLRFIVLRKIISLNHYSFPFVTSSLRNFCKNFLTCVYILLKRKDSMITLIIVRSEEHTSELQS